MLRAGVALFSAVLLLATGDAAHAARSIVDRNYECKIIASTREFPGGPDWLGPPAMNAWGQVVFKNLTTVGSDTIQELRVGRGDLSNGCRSLTPSRRAARPSMDRSRRSHRSRKPRSTMPHA